MRNLILFSLFFISFNLFAQVFNGVENHKTWKAAKKAENRVQFIVESTKAGMFSSDIDGYVKAFNFSGEFDKENMILRNMVISFETKKMDTDGESRDEKLHALCMSVDKYPTMSIRVVGPLFLKSKRISILKGTTIVRGKNRTFDIEMDGSYENGVLKVTGKSVWGLKEFEIPDPSIFIAKLSNEIRINIRVQKKL